MPFNGVFNTKDRCVESECRVNRKNIKTIYKPDEGIKDNSIKQTLFNRQIEPKMCDCIIECQDGKIVILEILCGTLTNSELNDKTKQLENCYKIAKEKSIKVDKIYLAYKKLDKKSALLLKKKLVTQRVLDKALLYFDKLLIDIGC